MLDKKHLNSSIPILVIAVILYGFLANRVIFSVGVLFASILCIYYKFWQKKYNRNYVIYSIVLIIVTYVFSDLIQTNYSSISGRSTMKLLLLVFPLFVWSWNPSKTQITKVNHLLFLTGGIIVCYSLMQYYLNFSSINLQYERAKVMPVLAFGDHIRISWFLAISCLMAYYELHKSPASIKRILVVYIIAQVVFLHLLGAKTGLLTLYLSTLIIGIGEIVKRKKIFLFIPLLLSLFIGPLVAYKTLPSFQKRIQFMKYDFDHYRNGQYRGGLSDAIRFYSISGGIDLFKEKPFEGHGFINSRKKMSEWYTAKHPEIEPSSYTLPSNQFLIFGIGAGMFGLLVFTFHVLSPFLISSIRTNLYFMGFYIPAMVGFLYETHLETQMAIFVYVFFLAWFVQLSRENSSSEL